MNIWVEAVGAAQGGILGLIVTMPIETVQKTQVALKAKGEAGQGAREILERLMKNGGVAALYRGFPVLSTMVASEKFLYYVVYTFGKLLLCKGGHTMSLTSNLAMGYIADVARLPVTMPLDLLSTRMQTSTSGTLMSIFNEVLQTRGIRGFYSGWTAYLVLALKPAIQILVFERLKARINRRAGRPLDASLTLREAFFVGALARLISTLICYPFFFARISAQSGASGGMKQVVREIWRQKGLGGFYTGIAPELARGMLFHAVNMASMEVLRDGNTRVLTGKTRSKSA